MVLTSLLAASVTLQPTVILVHGAGGGGWEWDRWRPVFEQAGYCVIAKDLMPAKGGLAATRLADYVDQVVAWNPKGARPVLVGASMGGPIVLEAALRLNARAIVLVNSVPPQGTGRTNSPPVVRWANGPLQETIDAMPDSDPATQRWAWKQWRDESGGVMNELGLGRPTAKPEVPVLFVLGAKDADIKLSVGRRWAKEWGAEVREYKGMSHVGPLLGTRATEVARDVLDWLGRAARR